MKEDALKIFWAGINAVDPSDAVERFVRIRGNILTVGDRDYSLSDFRNIYVVGTGKASAAMATSMEHILGDNLTGGILNTKYGHSKSLDKIRVIEAGHPVPDASGQEGARQIVRLLDRAEADDLIFVLISGGGSALLPFPSEGITLVDKQEVTRVLLEAGATIHEINAVRKHLSRVKGGNLTRIAFPAHVISLILSDVIGDDLDTIASGPTSPDDSTYTDCLEILDRYDIRTRIPDSVLQRLIRGAGALLPETPKGGDPVFERTHNLIIGSNILAAEAAEIKAKELGYNTQILSTTVEGEARAVAQSYGEKAREILEPGYPLLRPVCVISGGETTVTIQGKGLGGRNQEFALAAAISIDGMKSTAVFSGGTDGTDGPTDAAGAFADGTTIKRARRLGLDPQAYLDDNDSYHFFEQLDDLIKTGPTFTNVMDLYLIIVK
ncbi:glycerate kinase [Acidobacteriota bacterium]